VDRSLSLPTVDIPHLLRQHGLRPNKLLGQNFLTDESALQQVVEAAGITPQDVVLEIGPGLGSLTRRLAIYALKVVAVEVDSSLIPVLKQVVEQFSNVQVIEGDILALNPVQLVSQSEFLVVANIPYYITSVLIRHLLEGDSRPRRLVLTVQQEVARRICAAPGDMSLLALSVQVYGHPEIIAQIPANAFYPPPKVDSTIIRIDSYPSPVIPSDELDAFFQLIKAGFSQKRKTLRNSLAGGLHLSHPKVEAMLTHAQIDPMRRAETLSLMEWHTLTEIYSTQFSPII
jgi:16S rRNA (adenine1518-N6/adenine1519-N6)-dimethyltransferase